MGAITVGSEAIDRASSLSLRAALDDPPLAVDQTVVSGVAAAQAGIITSVQAYLSQADAGNSLKAGTFHAVGNVLTCVSAVELGEGSVGLNTWSSLVLPIAAGDYIGIDARVEADTYIDVGTSGGSGAWVKTGQYCDVDDSATFTLQSGYTISLYGVGATSYCRVKLAPQDPYAVSLAPTTPYEVTVAPSAPYVVTIL